MTPRGSLARLTAGTGASKPSQRRRHGVGRQCYSSGDALVGVSGRRDARVLTVGAGRVTNFLELVAVVALHTRLPSKTPSRAKRCWMRATKTVLAEALRCRAKGQNVSPPRASSRAVGLMLRAQADSTNFGAGSPACACAANATPQASTTAMPAIHCHREWSRVGIRFKIGKIAAGGAIVNAWVIKMRLMCAGARIRGVVLCGRSGR